MKVILVTVGYSSLEGLFDLYFDAKLRKLKEKAEKFIGPTVVPADFIRKVATHPSLSDVAKKYIAANLEDVAAITWYFVTNDSPVLAGELVAVESIDLNALKAEVMPITAGDHEDDFPAVPVLFAHLTSAYPE